MKKNVLLNKLNVLHNKLVNIFKNSNVFKNDIQQTISKLSDKAHSEILQSSNKYSTGDYAYSKINELERIDSDFRDKLGHDKSTLVTETHNNNDSKLRTVSDLLMHKNDINDKFYPVRTSMSNKVDNGIASATENITNTTDIDNALGGFNTKVNTLYNELYVDVYKLTSIVGDASTYAELPSKDTIGRPLNKNDIAYLKHDDGYFKKGMYIYNGIDYVYTKRKVHTIDSLKALIKAHKDNPDTIGVEYAIKYADTSKITNMSYLFYNNRTFNLDISRWDVSKVTTMNGMFSDAKAFNQPLNNWDVSKITSMYSMFGGSEYNGNKTYTIFNQNISNWDVSNVTDMRHMFSFNTNISINNINGLKLTNKPTIDSMFSSNNTITASSLSGWKKYGYSQTELDNTKTYTSNC